MKYGSKKTYSIREKILALNITLCQFPTSVAIQVELEPIVKI